MPEIGSYFQPARLVIFSQDIFFQTIGCAHGWVHSPLISATYVLLENFILKHFLAFSNYWLCIYLAHRWAHSIPCLIPNWSDLPSSSTLTISRSLPRWASEPAILQMEHILGFQFFSNAFLRRGEGDIITFKELLQTMTSSQQWKHCLFDQKSFCICKTIPFLFPPYKKLKQK